MMVRRSHGNDMSTPPTSSTTAAPTTVPAGGSKEVCAWCCKDSCGDEQHDVHDEGDRLPHAHGGEGDGTL